MRVNGLTGIALNKLDTLTGLPTLKICVAYKKNGKKLLDFPADISDLEGCEPIYEEYPGWTEDIGGAKSLADLPKAAVAYLRAVEKAIDCPVKMVGVGPDRTQNFTL